MPHYFQNIRCDLTFLEATVQYKKKVINFYAESYSVKWGGAGKIPVNAPDSVI